MPLRDESQRKRAWRPKVRTGCRTCKIRRIRCDEQKPYCNRCTSTGRKCDGYDIPVIVGSQSSDSSSSSESGTPAVIVQAPRVQPVQPKAVGKRPLIKRQLTPFSSQLLSVHPDVDPYEAHSFNFFLYHTGPSFSNFFDVDFWLQFLPQLSHSKPAVWHAIISLGALHERFLLGSSPNMPDNMNDTRMVFALKQFNLSIRQLIKPAIASPHAQLNKADALTVCVLFCHICNLQGQQLQALTHLKAGLKLLTELAQEGQLEGDSTKLATPVPITTLQALFTELDTQARAMLDEATLLSWTFKPTESSTQAGPETSDILGLPTVLLGAQRLLNDILHFFQVVEESEETSHSIALTTAEQQKFTEQLSESEQSLASILAVINQKDPKVRKAVAVTEICHIISRMWLYEDRSLEEMKWEGRDAPFQTIFDLCSEILRLEYGDLGAGGKESKSPLFAPTMMTTQPLFLVAARCRNPSLRRKALNHLLQFPRREGIWDSVLAGQVAKQVIEMEEAASGWDGVWEGKHSSEIPADLRVRDVRLVFAGTEKSIKVIIRTVGDWHAGREGFTMTLQW